MNSNLAPIALFVYNRPDHVQRTLIALQKNPLASDSELFVFSDGPRDEISKSPVENVRRTLSELDGFKAVHVIERESNWGLARSIIDGVTRLTEQYGRVIVLEDDLVTSPYFLQYMNDALTHYEHHDQVMHISGYMFPVQSEELPPTFFLRTASCWGWATWSRAWRHFEKDTAKLLHDFDAASIRRFNMDGTYDFWRQVKLNHEGIINTWAVFWYASVFRQGGLCLHPARSLVSNIGTDGSGVHCGESDVFAATLADQPVSWFDPSLAENSMALQSTKAFFRGLRPGVLARICRRLKSILIKVS